MRLLLFFIAFIIPVLSYSQYSCQHSFIVQQFTTAGDTIMGPDENGNFDVWIQPVEDLTTPELISKIMTGVEMWEQVSIFDFRQTTNVDSAEIKIFFSHNNSTFFDPPPFAFQQSTLAYAFPPYKENEEFWGHMYINVENINNEKYDLTTVVGHENGHIIGGGHSEIFEALMWREYNGVKDSLHQDDILLYNDRYIPIEKAFLASQDKNLIEKYPEMTWYVGTFALVLLIGTYAAKQYKSGKDNPA